MSFEDFEKMFDRYYERSTDRLRLRGDSHEKRQFVSKECGHPATASDPAAAAVARRTQGLWPLPNMLDDSRTLFLMDGEYAPGNTFQACEGYFPAAETPSKTFLFHTGTIYTNVQVSTNTRVRTECACANNMYKQKYKEVCSSTFIHACTCSTNTHTHTGGCWNHARDMLIEIIYAQPCIHAYHADVSWLSYMHPCAYNLTCTHI